ncbi:ribosome maturation factor RimM [Gorillibacterium massiliense]|uniref:ribosome maturation factor RimM n=1 Tax=Gorillibacterium massiliense TaxID=1280390 RepID=UPI0004B9ADCD|nr:ribosome maturation factor RimM [Gorillibacterium massiliense]
MSGQLFNVGKIVNTHGIRGEVKVVIQTDFADVRFSKGSKLLLQDAEEKELLPVTVESGKPQKNVWLVKFSNIGDINMAEKFKGWSIKVDDEHLVELEEDEFYHHEIIGCQVITEDGEELGTISEILSPGANDVWVVERPKGKGKPILIPYIDDVVLDVNIADKKVTVQLLEGLL